MDLTFQVPIQHCSLQHRTLLLSPDTSKTGCCFCFGSISSFFLKLFLHSSPVASWALAQWGSSSFSVISFVLFMLFIGFSRQQYWSDLPSLLQWTTFCQNSPQWPVRLGCSYTSYTRLWFMWSDWLVLCDCVFQSVCPLMEKDKRLWKLPDGRGWLKGKLSLVLMVGPCSVNL